jgi:hypothetical protein
VRAREPERERARERERERTRPCERVCRDPNHRIEEVSYTPRKDFEVKEHTILTCTPESHFKQIFFDGLERFNSSCFALTQQRETNYNELYSGIRRRGNSKPLELIGKTYIATISHNNGNVQRFEEAILHESEECHGDQLLALADFVSDEPVKGCCDEVEGVKHLKGVAFELRIYGKCCSRCYLQQSDIYFPKRVTNEEA